MGLLALRRWSCAKEPGWGLPGSQKRLSPRQLLVPTNRFNSQRDPRGWALPLPARLGKLRQLVSPEDGHVPDGAPVLCFCMAMS